MKQISYRNYLGVGTILAVCAASFLWFYTSYNQTTAILDFDKERDSAFILDIFKNNWYWLVSEHSDFSPEYMLEHKASSKDPAHVGNLTIKVLYQKNEPVGFVAYYKKKFYEGVVLFLAVLDKYRSQGYGSKLMDYALKDLASQYVTKIKLVTRTTNYSAMKVYTKAGFREISRDNGFVWFEYLVNK